MGKTFIIAEAGANHNRNFDQALSLIDVAKESGATAVKFQTYSSETLYAASTPDFAGYKNISKLIKDIELPRSWQKDLKDYCDESGIEFMSTPFDEKAVEELVDLGVKRLKISGFESTDPRFVKLVASTGLPIIMSIGIGFDLKYVESFLEIFSAYNNHLTLLHCNNAYPTPMQDANLRQMGVLSTYKGVDAVGFSDHTISTLTPSWAVALGATVIEKHFTISRKLRGPDHPFALEPLELKEMVDNIHLAELAIKNKGSGFTKSERPFSKAMRSVVSLGSIKKGEVLTVTNTTTKRPFLENSVPAFDYFKVLGKIVTEDIEDDQILNKNQIK